MSLTEIHHLDGKSRGVRRPRPQRAASVAYRTAGWFCKAGAQNASGDGGVWASSRFPAWGCAPVDSGVRPSEATSEAAVPTSSTARAGTSGQCGRHSNRLPRAGCGTPTPRRTNYRGSPDNPRASVRWHYGTVLTQQCPNPRRHLVASVRGRSKVPVAAGTARPPVGAGAAGRDTLESPWR